MNVRKIHPDKFAQPYTGSVKQLDDRHVSCVFRRLRFEAFKQPAELFDGQEFGNAFFHFGRGDYPGRVSRDQPLTVQKIEKRFDR